MNNLSFKSRIRPVSLEEFCPITNSIGRKGNVRYPWTLKESVLNDRAFTKGVIDCTVCGITDGDKVLMLHICPTIKKYCNIKNIEEFIKSKLKYMNKDYLQGFLLGSQGNLLEQSRTLFENFAKLLDDLKIPTSKFRAGYEETHVAYSSTTDEWLIACKDVPALKESFNNAETINNMFEYVEISKFDEIPEW